jgi:TPR repeat protein
MNAIGEFLLRSDQTANRTVDAVVWFKCAAGMGNPTAFRNLAVLYEKGSDVPQDLVEALKWYELAAAASLGAERDLANRNVVAIRERTTPANVQEARRLAQEWKREIDAACQDLLVQG